MTPEERRDARLRVLVADQDERSHRRLALLLGELGYDVLARATRVEDVSAVTHAERSDVALVRLHDDDERGLDLIEEVTQEAACPVILVAESPDPDFVARAAERGIFAFVRPVDRNPLQAAIEVSVRRHAELEQTVHEVAQLRLALTRRVLIERAKGLLMERHGIDDREAFAMLRDEARRTNQKVSDLARSVSDGHALLRRPA